MIRFYKDPFNDIFKTFLDSERFASYPETKITKNEEGYNLLMSLPGLSKNDVKILIKDQAVKIEYTKEEKTKSTGFVESFTKEYSLPDNIKESSIEAKLDNGILEIKFPFEKKKPLERLIQLN